MRAHSGSRLKIEWWAILLVTSVIVIVLSFDRTLLRFDNLAYDQLIELRPLGASDQIMIVAIDEESLSRVGRWPWPRETHARLIEELAKAKPRAIGYDVLFTEPGAESGDARLGAAMAAAKNVYVPLSFVAPGQNGTPFDILYPIASVRNGAAGVGHVNLTFDPGGTVRRLALSFGAGPQHWRHLMEEARGGAHVRSPAAPEDEQKLIPYAGAAGFWPTISAASVLAGEVPPEFLRDKFVLVGATAQALGDHHSVPIGNQMPGIEIQAHLLNGLITGQLGREAGIAGLLCLGLGPLWVLFLGYRLLPRWAAPLCVAAMTALVLLIAAAGFVFFNLWIPPAAALAGLGVSYPLWAWRQLASADAFMRSELKRFRAEPLVLPVGESQRLSGDQFDSTIRMLGYAIANARELRHFVLDRLDQLPDATLVTDMTGHVVLSNAAAMRLFDSLGISPDGRHDAVTLLTAFLTEPRRESFMLFRDDEGRLDAEKADAEVVSADGRSFAVRLAPQTSSAGARVGWVIRILDISENKAAQRQRDDIVQLLTHDMRSPQASIIALLETAGANQIDEGIASRIRHYARRTLGLADGFVQLARAESLRYVTEEIDVYDMVIDSIDDLWPQIMAKNIKIETMGETEGLIVEGERSLLTRALTNVIGNAIKYSGPGTRISCTLMRRAGEKGGKVACCAIADEGPGLPLEHQETIFERFQRAPLGIGRKVDGVGLGLSFVHTVMVRHNGDIRCVSEPGKGSTFTLLLPLIE